ncbi:hypothetical protein [Phaeodactylibacter xiamenensis]|uniref:hypothetical protein n=1 Tax=Phaeodactylibacter xiamenensis TaxID=1524460 RepID=UPI0024A98AC8|nr:hypothetical protein [Phaeodactylibacter xiamenensis]
MEKQADQPLHILAPSANGATAETQPPPELNAQKSGLRHRSKSLYSVYADIKLVCLANQFIVGILPGKEGLLNNFNPYRYAKI